jgi:hypothetical protein
MVIDRHERGRAAYRQAKERAKAKPSRNGRVQASKEPANDHGDAYEPPEDQLGKPRGGGNKPDKPDLPDGVEWIPPVPLVETPKVEDFPLGVFSPCLQEFAAAVAQAVGCPIDFVGLPMLVIAGGATGASRAIEIKAQYTQRPLLYGAVVGNPGDGKTPALDMVARPIHEVQKRLLVEFAEAQAQYQRDLDAYQKAKKEAEGEPDAEFPKPEKPHLERTVIDHTTVEAIARIQQENPRGIVAIKDELTDLVTSANQYKGGKGSDRQFWLKNWAGVLAMIDRKQLEMPIIIPHPFVAVIGGIQPDLLASMRDEKGRSDGFLDRFLFAFPDPRPVPEWTWDDVPEEAMAPWQSAIEELLRLNMEPTENGLRPHYIRLTDDARQEWETLQNSLVQQQNDDAFPTILKGPWAKLRVYAGRLALIIHLLRWVTRETDEKNVDGQSIRRADLLVRYFASHARKVYAVIGADPEIENAKRVLDWIARENPPTFKRWQIHKDIKNQERFSRVEDLDRPLDRLIKHGYIRARPHENKTGRGRPADPEFEVNPLWHHRANRKNRVNSPP